MPKAAQSPPVPLCWLFVLSGHRMVPAAHRQVIVAARVGCELLHRVAGSGSLAGAVATDNQPPD